MPAEIFEVEEFVRLSEKAKFCDVKRGKEFTKLKLRCPRILYTMKLEPNKVDEVFKRLKCEIREI